MPEPHLRQLFSTARLRVFLTCGILSGWIFLQGPATAADASPSPSPTPSPLTQELQGAQLAELAMMAKVDANPDTPESKATMEKLAKIYADISARNPGSVEAMNAEAEYLWKIGRWREAIAIWQRAETLEPRNAQVISHLGAGYLALGDAKKSTEYYELATTLEPKNAIYQYDAANSMFIFRNQMAEGTNDTPEMVMTRALEHYRQATLLEPFNADLARAYAETFYMQQKPDWETAQKAWTHFLEVTDKKDFAYLNLARVSFRMGRKEEGAAYLKLIQDPTYNSLKAKMLLQNGLNPAP